MIEQAVDATSQFAAETVGTVEAPGQNEHIQWWGVDLTKVKSDTWCSSYTAVTSASKTAIDEIEWDCRLQRGRETVIIPFSPMQIDSPSCADTGTIWQYWIEDVTIPADALDLT